MCLRQTTEDRKYVLRSSIFKSCKGEASALCLVTPALATPPTTPPSVRAALQSTQSGPHHQPSVRGGLQIRTQSSGGTAWRTASSCSTRFKIISCRDFFFRFWRRTSVTSSPFPPPPSLLFSPLLFSSPAFSLSYHLAPSRTQPVCRLCNYFHGYH